MKPTKKQSDGALGEAMTNTNFQKISWAPCVKPELDIGTDLLTFARSFDGEDLGLAVGIQVKSSFTEYSYPTATHRQSTGWWHTDSDRSHYDFWLRHGIPHLLVLTDLSAGLSYWAHVTGEAVVSTGVGYKLFVPASNIVDVANAERLISVARTGSKSNMALQGSWWNGRDRVEPTSRLRHAFMTPRIVAPHPNNIRDVVEPDEAMALLFEMRLNDLAHFSPLPGYTSKGPGSRTFAWRLVAAARELLEAGDASLLESVIGSQLKRSADQETAARILCSIHYFQEENFVHAVEILNVDESKFGSVDIAWMTSIRLMISLHCDHPSTVSDAARILELTSLYPDDVTVAPMRAIATWSLYRSIQSADNFSEALASADNAASWWRSRLFIAGFDRAISKDFHRWLDDRGERWHSVQPVNQFLGAIWNSLHTASLGAWKEACLTYGTYVLTRASDLDPGRIASAVRSLRRANLKRELGKGAQKLWREGPLDELEEAASDASMLDASSSTESVLELWANAGDLINDEFSQRALTKVLSLIDDPLATVHAGGGTYMALKPVLRAASRLMCSTPTGTEQIVDYLLKSNFASYADNDQVMQELFRFLNGSVIPRSSRRAIGESLANGVRVGTSIDFALSWTSEASESARGALLLSAETSDTALRLVAVSAFATAEHKIRCLQSVKTDVVNMLDQCRSGYAPMMEYDVLGLAAQLSMDLGNEDEWQPVVDALESTDVPTPCKRRAIWSMLKRRVNLPQIAYDCLSRMPSIFAQSPQWPTLFGSNGHGPELSCRIAFEDDLSGDTVRLFREMLGGRTQDRLDVAHTLEFVSPQQLDVDAILLTLFVRQISGGARTCWTTDSWSRCLRA